MNQTRLPPRTRPLSIAAVFAFGGVTVVALALESFAMTGAAYSQQTRDCGDLSTQNAMNLCSVEAFQSSDAVLNSMWGQLRSRWSEDPVWQSILDAQRAWIDFRDAHCNAEAAFFEGGSIEPMVRFGCLSTLTAQRTDQLRDLMNNPN